jgi:hypothetical protein
MKWTETGRCQKGDNKCERVRACCGFARGYCANELEFAQTRSCSEDDAHGDSLYAANNSSVGAWDGMRRATHGGGWHIDNLFRKGKFMWTRSFRETHERAECFLSPKPCRILGDFLMLIK